MKSLKKLYLLVLGFLMIQCDVVPNSGYRTNNPGSVDESKEFADLIEKDQIDKNKKTAEVLILLMIQILQIPTRLRSSTTCPGAI